MRTDRVGHPTNPNDQSLLGLLARGRAPAAEPVLWAALAVRCSSRTRPGGTVSRGGRLAGVTVTGLTACLISPISWVRHLYWVPPAVVVLVDVAAGTPSQGRVRPRRPDDVRRRCAVAAAAAALVVIESVRLLADLVLHPGAAVALDVRGERLRVLMLGLVAGLPSPGAAGTFSAGSQRRRVARSSGHSD